jgi:hypothetical protein
MGSATLLADEAPIVDQGQFCGRASSQTSTMRRSQLPPDHAMLRVTWPSAIHSARESTLPVDRSRCKVIAAGSAADDLMQVINR